MSEVIYEFTANHATELWSTDPAKMVDGTETSYASTTTDGDIQCLITNECAGTDLGTISKVELRPYAYSDDNDELILRPVFTGGDGDNHTIVPGVSAGWKAWQDITEDTNRPQRVYPIYEEYTTGEDDEQSVTSAMKRAQTFTPDTTHNITAVALKLWRHSAVDGTLTVEIYAVDGEGKPTGSTLTSGTKNEVDITASSPGQWYVVTLTSYQLTASTQYALVLSSDHASAVWWRDDSTSATYAGGKEWYDDGGGWAEPIGTKDQMFKEGILDEIWQWSDVQSLDCDVEQNDVGKGNTMYCGMVQIQVTYTPSGPTPGWNKLIYTSEPPTPNAWNQLKRDAGTGWKRLLLEGD